MRRSTILDGLSLTLFLIGAGMFFVALEAMLEPSPIERAIDPISSITGRP